MSKHTPGPWQVVDPDKAQSPWIIGDAEGGSIADCEPCGPWMPDQEADANARLIAAAPDMLAALLDAEHMLEAFLKPHEDTSPTLEKMRAAIRKAEGKS